MAQAASALDSQCLGSSLLVLDLPPKWRSSRPSPRWSAPTPWVNNPQVDFYVPELAGNAIALAQKNTVAHAFQRELWQRRITAIFIIIIPKVLCLQP